MSNKFLNKQIKENTNIYVHNYDLNRSTNIFEMAIRMLRIPPKRNTVEICQKYF